MLFPSLIYGSERLMVGMINLESAVTMNFLRLAACGIRKVDWVRNNVVQNSDVVQNIKL